MAVRQLSKNKFAFLQKYSNKELYTLIFTDYKGFARGGVDDKLYSRQYPSELVKVADLEIVAKEQISQITDILGITRFTTLQDVFESVQQLREQLFGIVPVDEEELVVKDGVGAISDADLAAGYDAGGGGGG